MRKSFIYVKIGLSIKYCGDMVMADEKNIDAEMDALFNDIFSEESGETMNTYKDENNGIFDLLGFSEEEKEKAAQELAQEDERYGTTFASEDTATPEPAVQGMSSSEEERLNSMLDDIFSDGEDSGKTEEKDTLREPDTPATPEVENTVSVEEVVAPKVEDTAPVEEVVAPKVEDTASVEESFSMPLSDEVLEGIDFNEDLTKSLSEDHGVEELLQEQALSPRALKKQQKKAEKEQRKAERAAAKQAKKEAARLAKEAKETEAITEPGIQEEQFETMISLDSSEIEEQNASVDAGVDAQPAGFLNKLSYVLFGPEEDDAPTEEELAAIEEKKAKKEQRKQEKQQKKAEQNEQKAAKKKQAMEMAVVKKAAAKDKKEKIRQQEEEEDAKEKRITPKAVVTVAVILLVLGVTVVFGTNQFTYHMAISRATNYFEMQKYKKAYEQIVGVDVKDRDKQIRDKIYCVMYVQSQLDAYDNFYKLEMYENALDSLVKGTRKYNAHIEEAKKLGIESDLNELKAQVDGRLQNEFGLTSQTVEQWLTLDQETYTEQLRNYVLNRNFNNETAKMD